MGPEERSPRALRFLTSSSRMTFKLVVLLCLFSTALGSLFTNGFQRTSSYCYIMNNSTQIPNIGSVYSYEYDTDVGSCRRGEGRCRCLGAFPRLTNEFVAKNICQEVDLSGGGGKIPANDPKGLKFPIYHTGWSACPKDTEGYRNPWMEPVRKETSAVPSCLASFLAQFVDYKNILFGQ